MSLDPAAANILVERLVAAVARAFYTDSYVVVFDTLLREKFIRAEELGPRLKMASKEVRSIATQLEAEMMIHVENMIMEDGGSSKCYYIDYQLFVNVVRYRLHHMTADIKKAEKSEISDVFFQCPTCKQQYSALEAQTQLAADFKFICTSCCPYENYRASVSQPSFRLVEMDKQNKLTDVQSLAKRIDEQLSLSNHHDSIYLLLHELKDVPLIRNRPSDNRVRGITASKIVDEDVRKDAEESIGVRRLAREAKFKNSIGQTVMGELIGTDEFQVTFDEDETNTAHSSSGSLKRPRDYQYPEFLISSRIMAAPGVSATSSDSKSATEEGDNVAQSAVPVSEQEQDDIDWED